MEGFDSFYQSYLQKLVRNEDSLILLFHLSNRMFVKYNLLALFKAFLRCLNLDVMLGAPKTQAAGIFAVQVS
jgi:hypothetical protein